MTVRLRAGQHPSRWQAALLVATATATGVGCGSSSDEPAPAPFDVMERSITEIASALDAGQVTSRELVAGYLARIEAYDQRGPALNAMIVLGPSAFSDADALDAERRRRAGARAAAWHSGRGEGQLRHRRHADQRGRHRAGHLGAAGRRVSR